MEFLRLQSAASYCAFATTEERCSVEQCRQWVADQVKVNSIGFCKFVRWAVEEQAACLAMQAQSCCTGCIEGEVINYLGGTEDLSAWINSLNTGLHYCTLML